MKRKQLKRLINALKNWKELHMYKCYRVFEKGNIQCIISLVTYNVYFIKLNRRTP